MKVVKDGRFYLGQRVLYKRAEDGAALWGTVRRIHSDRYPSLVRVSVELDEVPGASKRRVAVNAGNVTTLEELRLAEELEPFARPPRANELEALTGGV